MGNWNNYSYVNTTPSNSVPYARSFMMDRYIGQLSKNEVYTSRGVIYFSAGRKDPLPNAIDLYNINGVALTATATPNFAAQKWNKSNANYAGNNTTMKNSVIGPMVFWGGSDGPVCSDIANSNNYLWLDTNIPYNNTAKSIYDPCPAGWYVPALAAVEDFRSGVTANNSAKGLANTTNYGLYWPNYGTVDGTIKFGFFSERWSIGTIYGINDGYLILNRINGNVDYMRLTSSYPERGQTGLRGVASMIRCISMSY